MNTQDIPILKALGAKMDYLAQRQALITGNIANADTPDYRPQDLKEADFGVLLGNLRNDHLRLAATNQAHMPPVGGMAAFQVEQTGAWEVSPAGNAVIMEEQLIAANKIVSDYSLMTSLYQRQIGLMRTAIGR